MAKQSDHIENRFRQAAENISVPPNPRAWEKMEELLDRENRRKPVVFWWYLLFFGVLIIAGIFTYQAFRTPAGISAVPGSDATVTSSTTASGNRASSTGGSPAGTSAPGASAPGKPSKQVSVPDTHIASGNDGLDTKDLAPPDSASAAVSPSLKAQSAIKTKAVGVPNTATPPGTGKNNGRVMTGTVSRANNPKSGVVTKEANTLSGISRTKKAGERSSVNAPRVAKEEPSLAMSNADAEKPREQFMAIVNDTSAADLAQMKKDAVQDPQNLLKDSSQLAKKNDLSIKKDSSVSTTVKLKVTDNKWKLGKGLNLSITGELDATSLHHISLHEFKTLLGFGLGYRFSNRFSIQTGMFIQRAVYFANPEDYTVKAGSYISMYKISKIDANCLFYEIPLNARYDFLIGKGVRFYASAGLNSYIMKNEAYRYHATGATGYRMFDSTFTSNKNIFASTYFSAGVEKKITPSFSVQLEPYVKMPNSGLGEGKVKLYSSGAQLSIKFQPVKASAKRK